MGLISLVILLVIVGVVLGYVQRIPGIEPTIALLIKIVVIIAAVLFVWHAFGSPDIPLGR